jgi:pimeloyl-ACP methyl ester carboxylesterase
VPVVSTGTGPPLFLLHGWTLDHRMWQPQLPELAKHYRLVMMDRRGFGRSTAPPDLMLEADDVMIVADALGVDRFALAGLSQGAAVALDIVHKYPDRISAVALAGTPLPGLVPDADTVPREDYAALVRQGKYKAMQRHWLQHPLMQASTPSGAKLLETIVNDYDGRDLLQHSSLPVFDAAKIAQLPMPLLAMAGSSDSPWRIACAHFLAEKAPRGDFALVPDAGHVVNIAQPARFNTVLNSFLDRQNLIPS